MLTILRQGRTFFAQTLLAMALLAMGIQAALPQGYMLDRSGPDGALAVVFCTGHGSETRWLDLASGEMRGDADRNSGQDDGGATGPCAFAAASAAATLVIDIVAAPVPARHESRPVQPAALRIAANGSRPLPPVRAPPARV